MDLTAQLVRGVNAHVRACTVLITLVAHQHHRSLHWRVPGFVLKVMFRRVSGFGFMSINTSAEQG